MACRLCTTLKGWFFVQGGFPLPFCGCKFFPFSPPPPPGGCGVRSLRGRCQWPLSHFMCSLLEDERDVTTFLQQPHNTVASCQRIHPQGGTGGT